MATPKTFAGLTFQQIGFIFLVATPILTIQTMVLNLMADNRQKDFEAKEQREHLKFRNEVINSFDEVVRSIDNVYSFSDVEELIELRSIEAERSAKDYADKENKKQEDFYRNIFKHTIENAFYLDKNDSTFKVLFYRNEEDSVVILQMIPILTSDWEKGNY